MSIFNGEDMTLYVKNPAMESTDAEFGIPGGCTDLFAWNVAHSELVEFVSNLNPESRYQAVFVELEEEDVEYF